MYDLRCANDCIEAIDRILKLYPLAREQTISRQAETMKQDMAQAAGVAIPKSPRQQMLEEAIKVTTKDRNSAYGNPEDNFQNIADYWTAYWKIKDKKSSASVHYFTPNDVAQMMILMKMARLATNPMHQDSTLDVAGYAACQADIQASMIAKQGPLPTLATEFKTAGITNHGDHTMKR